MSWTAEGEAMLQAGLALQRVAATLPADSGTRRALLEDAERWITGARQRGVIG